MILKVGKEGEAGRCPPWLSVQSSCLEGHLPADCIAATMLPAATPPPLAIAAADIILAAMDAAAIPVPVKPMAVRTTGAAPTPTAVGRGVDVDSGQRHTQEFLESLGGSIFYEQQVKGPTVKKDRAGSQVEAERSVEDLTEPGSYQLV